MSTPTPKKRSTILVAVGAGVFVVGSGLAALATRDTGSTHNARSDTPVTAAANGAVAAANAVPTLSIPSDHQAMAVQVPFVQGLAGYAKTGDVVNVYSVLKDNPATGGAVDPVGKLILQKVKVLAVNSGADGGNATYMLSVDTHDAEAIAYLTSNEKVWLTLARDDQGTLLPKGFGASNA